MANPDAPALRVKATAAAPVLPGIPLHLYQVPLRPAVDRVRD
jgi:hypothetical protein